MARVSLNENSATKLIINLEKSLLNNYINRINDEFLVSEILAERLKIKYSIDSNSDEFYILKFKNQKLPLNYKNVIFKNPFNFELNFSVKESLDDSKHSFLYSVIVISKAIDMENSNDYFLSIEILNKANLKLINGIKKWKFQVFILIHS